ncbi:MAG: low molecular weight phosphotyrosine protein phosphatase [Rhodospirillaceae bacterium]|nr:low molecular weight phosphotyrosine protein phosphatase [Rhodospirillaceae bacterium]MCY4066751.1 low molecular weight phosphotyrosine protein phosphatase [Rhodospirillaceae bacterium]
MNILFVCTGNICRSPTGEAVLRRMADAAGLGDAVTVDSCGTHAYHIGQPPDARARRAGERRGYDFSGQRARQVAIADFDRFDLILAMDGGHFDRLRRAAPAGGGDRIRRFLDFAPGARRRDVPDPYYGGAEDYELALDLIEAGCRGIVAMLLEGRQTA